MSRRSVAWLSTTETVLGRRLLSGWARHPAFPGPSLGAHQACARTPPVAFDDAGRSRCSIRRFCPTISRHELVGVVDAERDRQRRSVRARDHARAPARRAHPQGEGRGQSAPKLCGGRWRRPDPTGVLRIDAAWGRQRLRPLLAVLAVCATRLVRLRCRRRRTGRRVGIAGFAVAAALASGSIFLSTRGAQVRVLLARLFERDWLTGHV